MNARIVISVVLVAAISVSVTTGQETRSAYGVFGNYARNDHHTDFGALPGVGNCCPVFETGSGNGYAAGLSWVLPLSDVFSLALRGSFMNHDAVLTSSEPFAAEVDGVVVAGRIEHSIASKLSTIGLEPLLGYRVWKGLRLHVGGRAGYVARKMFDQKEMLVEPVSVGAFENGARIRNELTGREIPDAAPMQYALLGGASWSLPLNAGGTLFMVPEVLYSYNVNTVVKGISWNADALRIGLSLLFAPLPAVAAPARVPERPLTTDPAPSPLPSKPALTATVDAMGVFPDGREEPVAEIQVEEFISKQMKPLLSYVFFEEGRSELPSRYVLLQKEETPEFTIDGMSRMTTMEMYHQVLNIIGSRMRQHPLSSITVTGCTSGISDESGNPDIARRRAEAVRGYLTKVWSIDPSRIQVQTRGLPEKPSNINDPDGIVENRRVEITSDTWEVVAPVTTHERERTITPPAVRFRPVVRSEAGVEHWSLEVQQQSRTMRMFADQDAPKQVIDWRITTIQAEEMKSEQPLLYTLRVADFAKQEFTAPTGSLPVRVLTVEQKKRDGIPDREIRRFNLILFDFDSPTLTAANQRVASMIRSELGLGGAVRVTGYTDRIGDEVYNQTLSFERARSTAAAIGHPSALVSGQGEAVELYDNNLPEGRFYNRTVEVMVER